MTKRDAVEAYCNWYKAKFGESADLLYEVIIRGFGHIQYVKIILTLAKKFQDNEMFLQYCDFIFESWSSAKGGGATVKYFPNWLASSSMMEQFNDYLKTNKIKNRNVSLHPTYSEHGYAGKSIDKPLFQE